MSEQQTLNYATPPARNPARVDLVFGIVSGVAGICLTMVAAMMLFMFPRVGALGIIIAIVVVGGAGLAGVFIAVRAIRRSQKQ